MKILNDLVATDYGLMSLTVILLVIALWIYFVVLFMGKTRSPAPTRTSQRPPQPRKPAP